MIPKTLYSSRPERAWQILPLIRLMVGAVFLTEGLQKFIYPALRGPGRFEKIGFAYPEFWGNFVGAFEVVAGTLLLLGLLTRLAALTMTVNMLVAIIITKIPILFGEGLGGFNVREVPFYNFWSMAHEMRTDWAMLLGSIVLLIAGSGPWALDRPLRSDRTSTATESADGSRGSGV
jgi:uncharacterized membrane protein YphA (DoxX/SURF4 family)